MLRMLLTEKSISQANLARILNYLSQLTINHKPIWLASPANFVGEVQGYAGPLPKPEQKQTGIVLLAVLFLYLRKTGM